MQAVILAGGLGSRLRGSIPEGKPKPMAPIEGRPFLEYLLESLIEEGVDEVILLVGYGADEIEQHFRDSFGGVAVRYSREPEPLGTGGALKLALGLLRQRFILLNGDTYVKAPLRALLRATAHAGVALSLAWVPDTARFGRAEVEEGRVLHLHEKGESGPGLINAGVYGLTRQVVSRLADGPSSLERDVLEPLVASNQPPYLLAGSTFFDIGVPSDYVAAAHYLSKKDSAAISPGS